MELPDLHIISEQMLESALAVDWDLLEKQFQWMDGAGSDDFLSLIVEWAKDPRVINWRFDPEMVERRENWPSPLKDSAHLAGEVANAVLNGDLDGAKFIFDLQDESDVICAATIWALTMFAEIIREPGTEIWT